MFVSSVCVRVCVWISSRKHHENSSIQLHRPFGDAKNEFWFRWSAKLTQTSPARCLSKLVPAKVKLLFCFVGFSGNCRKLTRNHVNSVVMVNMLRFDQNLPFDQNMHSHANLETHNLYVCFASFNVHRHILAFLAIVYVSLRINLAGRYGRFG